VFVALKGCFREQFTQGIGRQPGAFREIAHLAGIPLCRHDPIAAMKFIFLNLATELPCEGLQPFCRTLISEE
jgi:hypothetical protein